MAIVKYTDGKCFMEGDTKKDGPTLVAAGWRVHVESSPPQPPPPVVMQVEDEDEEIEFEEEEIEEEFDFEDE